MVCHPIEAGKHLSRRLGACPSSRPPTTEPIMVPAGFAATIPSLEARNDEGPDGGVCSGLPFLCAAEGVEVALVGVGEGGEVLLGGLDLGVAHAVHHGHQVGAAGE